MRWVNSLDRDRKVSDSGAPILFTPVLEGMPPVLTIVLENTEPDEDQGRQLFSGGGRIKVSRSADAAMR